MAVIPSVCEQHPGMCAGDPDCPDHACPGHPRPIWAQMHRIDRIQLGRPMPEPEPDAPPMRIVIVAIVLVLLLELALYH